MKTIVHTLRFGPEPNWMTRCRETLESWCERTHYPLTVWSDPSVWSAYPSPKFVEKDMLEVFLASDADRLLYIDADVYVNPKSPAFPIIAGVAMATDIWHKDHTERWKQWCVDTYHDNKILGTKRDYTNAGVWSCDRESARKILSVMEGLPMVESFQDQDWWNYCVWKSGAKFSYLPSDWNRYARDYNPGWFLHLWGENKDRDLQTLDDLGLLDFEPDGLIHCLHPQPWPTSDKVIVQEFIQDAGLGNQLFEFAAGYGIAKRLGLPFMWSWKPSLKREFGLTRFKFAQNYLRNDLVMQRVGQGNIKLVRLAEQRITESESRFVGISCPFQAEECFSDVAAEAREFYKLDPYPIRVPRYCTAVGMQVRRGDYIGHSRLDVVTPDYFYNAMAYLRNRIDKPHFFVVSDDPGWCMQKFGHLDDVTVMPEQTAIDGLRTLATCEAHIISNSTFGWWGAWLGEKGPVVVPEIWHQKAGSYGDWNPVPARWHKVPVRSSISRVKVTEVGEIPPRLCDRAVVYPWKSDGSVWQELRFSLRSIERFFADKECPIYILGTRRPAWLLFGEQRVRFLDAHTYSDALIRGVTLADEVLWINDDILLLKPTTWEDCRRTLYLRDVGNEFLLNPGEQTNPWREGAIKVLKQLRDEGVTEQRVYCTHTPYVYRREEAIQTLRRFGVWEKMPFELAYFHRHAVDPLRVTDERTMTADFGNARFLNWTDNLLTPELREAIKTLLPDYAPWELVAPLRV